MERSPLRDDNTVSLSKEWVYQLNERLIHFENDPNIGEYHYLAIAFENGCVRYPFGKEGEKLLEEYEDLKKQWKKIRDKPLSTIQDADTEDRQSLKEQNTAMNSQTIRQLNTKQKRKINEDFKGLILYNDKEKLLNRLHKLIDGNGGKRVGLVLNRAYYDKLISSIPTQGEFKSEFRLYGSWQAIYKYTHNHDNDIADIKIFE